MYRSFQNKSVLIVLLIFKISLLSADDYYWIGGNGNWSDINHWSKTSGGSILHIQVPTSADNVFFDENSFTGYGQAITVNTENAICKDIDWTGALFVPTFKSDDNNNIRVYGSVTFIPQMVQEFEGTFTFESDEQGNTIKTGGQSFNNHIYFDGVGGSWLLIDSLWITGNIYLVNGGFSSGSQNIKSSQIISTSLTERMLDISNSLIEIGGWNIMAEDLEFEASNSLIRSTGSMTNYEGDTLNFHKIEFLLMNTFKSNDVYSTIQTTTFTQGGSIQGTLSSDTIIIDGNGSIMENVTSDYVIMGGGIINGNNIIHYAFSQGGAGVIGSNTINHIEILGNGAISENNNIQFLLVGDTAQVFGENSIGEAEFGLTSWVD